MFSYNTGSLSRNAYSRQASQSTIYLLVFVIAYRRVTCVALDTISNPASRTIQVLTHSKFHPRRQNSSDWCDAHFHPFISSSVPLFPPASYIHSQTKIVLFKCFFPGHYIYAHGDLSTDRKSHNFYWCKEIRLGDCYCFACVVAVSWFHIRQSFFL